jgi:hypothetical protein
MKGVGLSWRKIAQSAYESRPDDLNQSRMWEEQCFTNFPILYLSSIYLHQYVRERERAFMG